MPVHYRAITVDDLPFVWDMLWLATSTNEGMRALGRDVALGRWHVAKYLNAWGRAGDGGVVARTETELPIGAAWHRLFSRDDPGYGFVSDVIPELTIGVVDGYRNRGVGHRLLTELIAQAQTSGCSALSLSVNRLSPAKRLYNRLGFRDANESTPQDSSVTLILPC